MRQGHVFVVRGRLEAIDAEAVIIPTDASFTVEDRWQGVWGGPGNPRPARPDGWRRGAALPSNETVADVPKVWFVDVAVDGHGTASDVVTKIVAGVQKVISACSAVKSDRRSLPLVALPTLGVGGGGLDSTRGRLIASLLSATASAAAENGVDVVIVAYRASDYAAFQHERRRLRSFLPPELEMQARALADRAQRGELALFVGAGVSMSAGLPSWETLLENLSRLLPESVGTASLNPLDAAELLSREIPALQARIREQLEPPQRAGLSHLLLAGLGCEEAVTTNFDLLYERAAEIDDNTKVSVLPWDSMDTRRPWLLKMHGDIGHEGSIVLSRGDFIRFGRQHGPGGAVLQALMLSRHLLVVGASMTDDNFLRLAYEVDDYVVASRAKRRQLGTVLTLDPQPVRQRLYGGLFQYVDTTREGGGNERGRDLAVFLDALAMYASTDSSFLLDPRYEFLLADDEKALVREVAELLVRVVQRTGDRNDQWQRLGVALRGFGARQ